MSDQSVPAKHFGFGKQLHGDIRSASILEPAGAKVSDLIVTGRSIVHFITQGMTDVLPVIR
ncbi:hypothetical protein BV494_08615 [Rahnella sikkimica]|uniref:Uncharacterized protein n=1 Tax=Rahnella sikkimica TaxID=1805933 RepID=A0A2L1UPY6_9GAMM|nr:hypothetical protein BV494_08615 [Rahnella sikkimica]